MANTSENHEISFLRMLNGQRKIYAKINIEHLIHSYLHVVSVRPSVSYRYVVTFVYT